MSSERTGIVLQGVYDGISVFIDADGEMTNRWDELYKLHPNDVAIKSRWTAANEFIQRRKEQQNDNQQTVAGSHQDVVASETD